MTSEIRELIKKESLTDEEKKTLQDAVKVFRDAVEEVCRSHGFAYKAVLQFSKEGIAPILEVVAIDEPVEVAKESNI